MLEQGNSKREIATRALESLNHGRLARLRPRQYQDLPTSSYPYLSSNKQNDLVQRPSKLEFGSVALVRQLEVKP
jgi:hypothetical protein